MIRDEFKQKKKEDLSSREIKQIRRLGERVFYSTSVNKIKDNIKLFDFSAIGGLITCIIPYIYIVDAVFFVEQQSSTAYVAFAILTAVLLFVLVWFTVCRPILKKNLKKYQSKLQEMSNKEVNKYKNLKK